MVKVKICKDSGNKKKLNSKGQIFSIDATVSLMSFVMIFMVVLAVYNLYATRLNDGVLSNELQLNAFLMSNSLINTKGEPINWHHDVNNTTIMGLAKHSGIGDQEKIDVFMNMDYNLSKQIFNIEKFEYYFRVFDENGELLNKSGERIGNESIEAVSVNRFVLIDNQTRQLQLLFYRN